MEGHRSEGIGVSQASRILAHLEAGNTITPREAYELFGTLALHSRISELRERGNRIECQMQSDGRTHWGEYFLAIPHG